MLNSISHKQVKLQLYFQIHYTMYYILVAWSLSLFTQRGGVINHHSSLDRHDI